MQVGNSEMPELSFVNYGKLNPAQVHHVAELMFETGYYDYVSIDNKLQLQPIPFQIEQTLLPCAQYTQALMHQDNTVIGFFMV